MSWLSVIGGALLSKGGGIPNLPGFGLGDKESSFEGQTIWTQYSGIKRDDNSSVSVFIYHSSNPSNQPNSNPFIASNDPKLLLTFAKNSLKKLRSLRHPDVLKFIDGTETDSAVYIITEKSALKFLNGPGAATHGNLRLTSIFITQSGEWKLSGFEVLSSPKDPQPILYTLGGSFPESARYASPEVMKNGYDVLKELKAEAFWEIGFGNGESGGGVAGAFFRENRLIKVCNGLEGFSLASQGERAALVKSIKDSAESLPPEFLKFRVLPSLVHSFDHGTDGPTLLPLAISISSSLSQAEFSALVLQALIKIYASPDRAIRLSLLELLPQYVHHLDRSVVVEKIWPSLLTGFADTVPIIREATVKSVLLLAPKLSERILNNDLLRHLAKTQMDVEPGIRTNTCILLGRLSKSLSLTTCRKVLVPAFTRSVRDPFTPARIAGLMALMATVDYYSPEDLVGKVIPGMSICLMDKEKPVREQAFKALDMFLERPESDTSTPASLGDTVNNAISSSQPGMALNAAGAAGALASWAFSSVSRKLTSSELAASPDPKIASGSASGQCGTLNSTSSPLAVVPPTSSMARGDSSGLVNAFTQQQQQGDKSGEASWVVEGELMNVEADSDDWSTFETGPKVYEPSFVPLPSKIKLGLQPSTASKPIQGSGSAGGGRLMMKLGQSGKGSQLLGPMKGKPSRSTSSAALVAALEADNELDEMATWGPSFVAQDQEDELEPEAHKEHVLSHSPLHNHTPLPPSVSTRPPSAAVAVSTTTTESKAAHMARMKEERRAKMAALKAKKASASGP
ncbi:uncharacterized protein VP01_191g17 [Puccinia sorghi]|uniref:Protein kinase domain-containing protein n=1 Tax=Puccinia sorghi TaxID=27349 RepID=A0A0L6VCN0_9BASI|nr:uncharacterized protein VP01_191g17 [Puccinia sorghi]